MAQPSGDRAAGLLGLDAARTAGAAAAGGAVAGVSSYSAVEPNSPPQSPTANRGGVSQVREVKRTLPDLCGASRRKAVVAVAFVGLLVCSVIGAVVARNSRARVARARAAGEGLPADEQGVLSALGVRILLPWETTYTTTTTTVTSTGTSTVTTTTTTTATTTSTRTVTNTTTTSSRNPYPSLFCFSVMRADGGNELSLLRNQLERGASIFQCDFWAVYSDTKTWLTPGPPVRIETTVIDTSLEAPAGQIEHILNTDIFLQAFEQVHKHPDFERSDWVVKIDPDAVFLPDRLRTHLLSAAPEPGSNLYFWNCPASFKLFGAVEVFSKEAMNQFFQNLDKCKTEFPWQEWGEDLFLRRCMDLLGVEHKEDFGLLTDAYCGEQPFPCNSGKVAFHPFKAPETYFQCLEEATGGAPTPAPAPPAQIETAEDQPRPAAPPAVEAAAAVVPEEAAGSQEIRVLKDQPRPAAALAAEAAAARAPEDPPPPRPAAALAAEAAAALAPEEPVAATASV